MKIALLIYIGLTGLIMGCASLDLSKSTDKTNKTASGLATAVVLNAAVLFALVWQGR